MSSIQERLQLKRVPLDTWNIREQLCLASAVVKSGDQNWMSVSRSLKTIGEPNRPPDWYSQKSCAAQYEALLEHVETPKRKKRNSEGAVETPQESILKKLTQERIAEIQKNVAEMNQLYDQLKAEIAETRNPATSEERIREMWTNIESAKKAKERESARRAAWLKEREERRARADRGWRPSQPTTPTSPVPTPTQTGPPASPLLTSLLKSSPVVTTPQHIPHPCNVVDVVSPSVTAPTLSMLLEKSSPASTSTSLSSSTSNQQKQNESRHAAIEHIKIQLQEIEHQFNVATTSGVQMTTAAPPAVDIDDIEIKAEDVYAFRDIDINIPPVGHMHKSSTRAIDKTPVKKDEAEVTTDIQMENTNEELQDVIKVEPLIQPAENEAVSVEDVPQEELLVEEKPPLSPPGEEVTSSDSDIRINFPEVKFPTTEIKVIQPDELKSIKEEVKEPDLEETENKEEEPGEEEQEKAPEEEKEKEEILQEPIVEKEEIKIRLSTPSSLREESEENVKPEAEAEETLPEEKQLEDALPSQSDQIAIDKVDKEVDEPVDKADDKVEDQVEELEVQDDQVLEIPLPRPQDIPLPPDEPGERAAMGTITGLTTADEKVEPPLPPEPEEEAPPPEKDSVEAQLEEMEKEEEVAEEKTLGEIKRDEEAEDSIPLKQMIKKELSERPLEENHTETDDDTPMELSREEEKDGKKKRDYSRKKKLDSRTWSGSESAPESPGGGGAGSGSATDADKHHRLWKKSVMLVYNRLCGHKYASLFLRPISDEEAPGYSLVVKKPMDLSTIRRNIDNGTIRTTAEFHRDVLLMLSNALIYNSSKHSVYTMAKEMHEEAISEFGILVAAQAHAGLSASPAPRRKRRRPDEHEHRKKTH